jgi:type IV pilus assembly protein PilA
MRALIQFANPPGRQHRQRGFSLIELLIVVAIILIIAAIAIPNLLNAKIAANEAAATCGLSVLIDNIIANLPSQKSGFSFAYTPVGTPVTAVPGCSAPGSNAYLVTATPITEFVTGIRSFCSDEPGTIHFDTTGTTAGTQNACEALPALQ